ncbi:MAG: tyrosine-type recombinase/integrase [Bacillota bacterium]
MLQEFLLSRAASGAAKKTLEDYTFHVNCFLRGTRALQKAVLEYLSEEAAPATRNTRLRKLRAFFNRCVAQGYIPANPTAGIKQAREDLDAIRHVPLEAIKKLLEQPNKRSYTGLRDYCLLLVQLDTGARPSELFQVKVSDVNFEAREIYIKLEVVKTRVGRVLVISPFTCQALAKLVSARPGWWGDGAPLFATETGRPLDRSQWAKRVRQCCQKAGIRMTPYSIRHTFALQQNAVSTPCSMGQQCWGSSGHA